MKRFALTLALLISTAAQAQQFSIGPRYSNFSTDVDAGLVTEKTGRQSSYGVTGDYRNGGLVLDFMYDHDSSDGVSVVELIGLDAGTYSRGRGEATVGYAALPFLDLQVGARSESVRVGGATLFGNNLFSTLDLDHQAIVYGARLHSPASRPFGVYGGARGYLGSARFDQANASGKTTDDTTGYRFEGGLSIPLGESAWSVDPGLEYEHIETKTTGVKLDTNRFLVNFIWHSGRR